MDEQQEALKRIHDKMIFDCLNEALDGKRILGLKGCPLPVDLLSLANNEGKLRAKTGKIKMIKDTRNQNLKSTNLAKIICKTQNSKSEHNTTENSAGISQNKYGSRSQTRGSNFEVNKENILENNSLSMYKFPSQKKAPLVKVFEKTSEQIKKWALFMCGMYEHKPENFKYLPETVSPIILERIKESRMTLLEINEMEELGQKMNDYDDEKYEINLSLNDFIWDELLSELCFEFNQINLRKTLGNKEENSQNAFGARINSQIKIGSDDKSNIIPTEEAITKIDYFPNYSENKTEKTNKSNLKEKDLLNNSHEHFRSSLLKNINKGNFNKIYNCKILIKTLIYKLI